MAKIPKRNKCYGCTYIDSHHPCSCPDPNLELRSSIKLPRTTRQYDLDNDSLENSQTSNTQFFSCPDDWPNYNVGDSKIKQETDSEDDVSDDICSQCFFLTDLLDDIKAVLKTTLSATAKLAKIKALL